VVNIEATSGRSTSSERRSSGTALLLSSNDDWYLLTSKHVVVEKGTSRLATPIFRVRSLDEVIANVPDVRPLATLAIGVPGMYGVSFDDELDLALISLEGGRRDGLAWKTQLAQLNYLPLPMDEIADGPSGHGADILTVGFPAATSSVRKLNLHPAQANWASNNVSLPVFSFVKIAMMHDVLPNYWADLTIYPGNSGGPVLENGRLVGIVSGQAIIPVEGQEDMFVRIPFALIVKTANVKKLIAIQEQKDRAAKDPFGQLK
jgi:hypothetical protein